jgi:hypothetical protein
MNRYVMSVAVLAVTGSVCAQAVQWAEAEGGNGHWYLDVAQQVTWAEADATASAIGGHLATTVTYEEFQFVWELGGHARWLGAGQPAGSVEPAGGWEWVTGEPWEGWPASIASSFFDDCVGNCAEGCTPDGQQDRVITWQGGRIDDINEYGCPENGSEPLLQFYMLEWSADCNGDDIVDYGQILSGALDDADGNGVPDCCDAGEPCDMPGADLTVDDDLLDYPDADFTSIQAAVDAAMDGDTVLVYPGTYLETGALVINLGVKSVSIISSAGADVTIVDGEDARGGLFLEGSQGLDTVIQGFTFTRCGVEGIVAIEFWRASGPTLSDCVIRDCAGQVLHSGPQHLGDPVGSPYIVNCEFIDNTPAVHGQAVMTFNYNSPVIEDCIFRGNEARFLQGSYWSNNLPTYVNCLFEGNVVGNEGLMHALSSSKVTLQGCTFSNNSMPIDCVLVGNNNGWYEVSDTTFCGNTPGNSICANWTNLGGNEFLDECTGFVDCNENGVPDYDDIDSGYSEDCNTNGVPDECDIADGTSSDCNANSIPDECESLADCDGDGTSDACDILGGALDVNPADGVPDECQGLPLGACCHGGGCVMSTFEYCFAAQGSYAGNGVSCADAGCPADCPTDVFADGVTDINDLLLILSEFGSVCP